MTRTTADLAKKEIDKFTEDTASATCVRVCGESIPAGLANQGIITLFEVDDSDWTRITLGSFESSAPRRAATLQNIDGNGVDNSSSIIINYALPSTPTVAPVATYGIAVAAGAERFYDVNDNVDFWVRVVASSTTFNITVEEIA